VVAAMDHSEIVVPEFGAEGQRVTRTTRGGSASLDRESCT
jgi:hypothetical protein